MFEDSEMFKLNDNENKKHNSKLSKKSDFDIKIDETVLRKFENLKRRCKTNKYSIPRLETVKTAYDEALHNDMKCPYCGITMMYFTEIPKMNNKKKCDYPFIMTLEHKQPLSKGGGNTKDNIVMCCLSCNLTKDTMLEDDYIKLLNSIDFEMKMKLYYNRVDIGFLVAEKMVEADRLKTKMMDFRDKYNNLEKTYTDEIYKKDNTIRQLRTNITDVKNETYKIKKDFERVDETEKLDDSVDILKDLLIIRQKEQIKNLKYLYLTEEKIKHIELKLNKNDKKNS